MSLVNKYTLQPLPKPPADDQHVSDHFASLRCRIRNFLAKLSLKKRLHWHKRTKQLSVVEKQQPAANTAASVNGLASQVYECLRSSQGNVSEPELDEQVAQDDMAVEDCVFGPQPRSNPLDYAPRKLANLRGCSSGKVNALIHRFEELPISPKSISEKKELSQRNMYKWAEDDALLGHLSQLFEEPDTDVLCYIRVLFQ